MICKISQVSLLVLAQFSMAAILNPQELVNNELLVLFCLLLRVKPSWFCWVGLLQLRNRR